MKIIFETERFYLREFLNQDLEDLFELDSDPEVHRFLGNKPFKKIEESQKIIEHVQKQYKKFGFGRLAIIDKKTNDFIGWSGLRYEQSLRKEFAYNDLGYRLKRKYWGNGIATETALKSLEYGFNQINLEKINAAADIDHVVSNRILQKVGLKFIETFEYDGKEHNWYELKKSDWEKLNK